MSAGVAGSAQPIAGASRFSFEEGLVWQVCEKFAGSAMPGENCN